MLKPNDDYGGHGIYIGWNSTAEEWDDAIEIALADGDYLVQERVRTAKELFPMLFDELGELGRWSNSSSISIRYLFDGQGRLGIYAAVVDRTRERFVRRRNGADIYHQPTK